MLYSRFETERGPQTSERAMDQEMPQEDFGLAVIGCGRWGRNHVRAAFEIFGDGLRSVCDHDPEARSRLPDDRLSSRFTTQLDSVLEDDAVSAVVIATPAETHYQLARRSLEAGKHALVENSMMASL